MASSKRRSRARFASPVLDDSVVEIESPAKKAKLTTPSASTTSSSGEYTWEPSELQVGTYKPCHKVQIYAKLTRGDPPAVLFKLNVQAANRHSKIQFYKEKVNFDQIDFAPEFDGKSEKDTKEYIKSKFTKSPNSELSITEPTEEPEEEPIEASSSSEIGIEERNEPRNTSRKRPALSFDSESSKPPSNKPSVVTKTLSSLGDICSALEEHAMDGFRAARDAVEDVVLNLESEIDALHGQKDELENHIVELKDQSKTQELTIAEYKRRFGSLDKPLKNSNNARLAKQPTTPASLPSQRPAGTPHLAMRSFENVPQRSNDGLMQEKRARRVNYGGNWYEERIIVEELIPYKTSGTFHGSEIIDGRTFTTFKQRSGGFKYLEMPNPGTDCIATADGGRKFAKWTLLKPLDDPNDLVDKLSESPEKTNSPYSSGYR